jgi:hypothetical protein
MRGIDKETLFQSRTTPIGQVVGENVVHFQSMQRLSFLLLCLSQSTSLILYISFELSLAKFCVTCVTNSIALYLRALRSRSLYLFLLLFLLTAKVLYSPFR